MIIVDTSVPGSPGLKFGNNDGVKSPAYLTLTQKKGSYWLRPDIGTTNLGNDKVSDDVLSVQDKRTKRALTWMIDVGRITSVDQVIAERSEEVPNKINKEIEVSKTEKQDPDLTNFVPIG